MNLKEFDNFTQPDYLLGTRKEGKLTVYTHYGWLKHMKKTPLPKIYRPMLHYIGEGSILIVCPLNEKLVFYNYNANNNKVNEMAHFPLADYFHVGGEFIHQQSFLLSSKYLYLIKNSFPSDEEHIYIFDLQTKRLHPIKNDNTRPSSFRINYTANLFDYRLLFFGGLDFQLKPLNIIEAFNLLTYKWEKVETKGKSPEPRHSHNSFLVGSNLYIMGGAKTHDIFSKQDMFDDFFLLNLTTMTWTPIKMYGTPPKHLAFNYTFQLSEKYIIILSYETDEEGEENKTKVYRFDSTHFEWEKMQGLSSETEYRIGAGHCLDDTNMVGYVFGGVYMSKLESQSLSNEMDRIKFSESKEEIEKVELFAVGKSILESPAKKEDFKAFEKEVPPPQDGDSGSEDISFEELLEREKKLQEEERMKLENQKSKKKKSKKKKDAKDKLDVVD